MNLPLKFESVINVFSPHLEEDVEPEVNWGDTETHKCDVNVGEPLDEKFLLYKELFETQK